MYSEIIIKVLTSVPIFKDISPESIIKLAQLARLSQYDQGATIFREGDPGDCLYIIASGKVDILAGRPGGEEIKLRTMNPGEVFGEMALLDGLPRSASVKVCAGKAILFCINRTDFNLFLIRNPEVSLKLVEAISRRLRDTNIRMKELIDENENIKTLMQSLPISAKEEEKPDTKSSFTREEYPCPNCDWSIKTLKLREGLAETVKIDGDFCPHYKDLNPIYYDVTVCPVCGYAFNDSLYGKIDPQEKGVLQGILEKLGKPRNHTGPRSLDQAIEAYQRACYLHGERDISSYVRAELLIRLAWLYRYKKDTENEKKYLGLALNRYKDFFEDPGDFPNPMGDIYIMYMIAMIYLDLGITADAQKWLFAITRHNSMDKDTQLVEKARSLYQEIKYREKMRR
ncbi:MAG: hypothetical protein JL50_13710 [Peptococcaceae bacterium BICA1-7]|nr:MAG: hypothetical protein JL50_13710 [Peptococcaceae bacterium BICA1-7]